MLFRPVGRALQRVRGALPHGATLTDEQWWVRHRAILVLLWLHVPAVVVFGLFRGVGLLHASAEASIVAVFAFLATQSSSARRTRAGLASIGLLVTSAVLVHLSGGLIEMHFHFFVMISVITLYQDWIPYLLGIGFTATHHSVMGILQPREVFDHPAAWNAPWKWAAIHAGFVLAASAASIVAWRLLEDQHEHSEASIRAREQWFRSLIEHAHDVIVVLDVEGKILYESPSVTSVLGYGFDERVGQSSFDYIHPDDIAGSAMILGDALHRPGSMIPVLLRGLHADGSWRWLEVQLTNLLDVPIVDGLVANFRDVTERRALEEQLAHQAFHDPLTGLANRALFIDRVGHALGAR
ncbi:MAG: hypothetical protein QOG64_724, partial [Acidimicrobiaceae bacterium]|nr:hypothetical protein [Acidimicrobiaceae bacterium]